MHNILWSVRVDWTHVGLNESEADELLEALADVLPVLVVDDEEPGHSTRYTLTVHLEEPTVRQAIALALRRVEDATGQRAVGVEALSMHEVRRRLATSNIPDLVGNADIADMLGVTRQRAGQIVVIPGFPPAVMTIKAGPLRVREQVEDWAQSWRRKSGRPAKEAPAKA